MTRTLCRFVFAVAAFVATISLIATPVVAQTVYTEAGDASHVLSDAQNAGSADLIQGGLTNFTDQADLFTWTSPYATRVVVTWGVQTPLSAVNSPYGSHSFIARNTGVVPQNRIWAESPDGENRSVISVLIDPFEEIVIGVGAAGNGNGISGTFWQTDPVRIEPQGQLINAPPSYTIMLLSVQPAHEMLLIPSVDLFDRRDSRIPTFECELHRGVIQDQRSQADPYGPEARRGAFHVGASCTDQVITVSMLGNAQMDCVVMNPDGSFAEARSKNNRWSESGFPEQYLPPANFQDGRSDGAICTQPLAVGQTVFFGVIVSASTGSPRGPNDCDMCVRTPASANPVTATPGIALVHNPRTTFAADAVTVTEDEAGEKAVSVHVTDINDCSVYAVHLPGKGQTVMVPVPYDLQRANVEPGQILRFSTPVPSGLSLSVGENLDYTATPGCYGPHAPYQPQADKAVSGTTMVIVPSDAGPAAAVGLTVGTPFPNPVAEVSAITLSAPALDAVRVVLLDVRGREVAVLFEGALRDVLTVPVDVRALPAGLYLVRAATGSAVQTATLSVVR